MSSQEYFSQLLAKWPNEWVRLPVLQGLATSAVAGAEGLVRSSRAAVIQFINSHDPKSREGILIAFLQVLSASLSDNLQDDRYAIPIIEFVAFLIDSYATPSSKELDPIFRKLFALVQKAHFRSSNIIRLEAAVKVYGALSMLEPLRPDVLKKLSGMLLHPFPRVCWNRLFRCVNLTHTSHLGSCRRRRLHFLGDRVRDRQIWGLVGAAEAVEGEGGKSEDGVDFGHVKHGRGEEQKN